MRSYTYNNERKVRSTLGFDLKKNLLREKTMEQFCVRPGNKTKKLLIEFLGNHRSEDFPDVAGLLANGLDAKPIKHPLLDTVTLALITEEFISQWKYNNGEYELDNSIGGFFIYAHENNAQVIADIENVLLASNHFVKIYTDFNE